MIVPAVVAALIGFDVLVELGIVDIVGIVVFVVIVAVVIVVGEYVD